MASCVRLALICNGLLFFGSAVLRAQEPPQVSTSAAPLKYSAFASGSGIQWMGYLLTVLVLGGAAVAFMARGGFFSGLRPGGKGVRKLQIEETRMVGARQYLVVAEYEGRRMLLGVSPGRIDYLSALELDSSTPSEFSEVLSAQGARSDHPKPVREV